MSAVRDLVLVGSGPMAREVLGLVEAVNALTPTWRVLGLLDDDPAKHGSLVGGVPVLGGRDAVADHPTVALAVCTGRPGDPGSRRRIPAALDLPDDRWATLVHPSCVLGPRVEVGHGTVLLAGVVATADVTLGAHCVVMPGTVLTHDDVLGEGVIVASGVRVSGTVSVGDSAYLGAGCLLREGITVGREAVVGMGAVVLTDVPAGETWVGSPARRLR